MIADRIDAELRRAGTSERAAREKRCLKSELQHYGVTVWAIRRIVKAALAEETGVDRSTLVAAVESLWGRGIHDCRMAVELLDFRGDMLEPRDLELVERLIRESKTWALVDGLAASVAGGLVERHPELAPALDRWAADEDFWVRRSALLALLGPIAASSVLTGVSWVLEARSPALTGPRWVTCLLPSTGA